MRGILITLFAFGLLMLAADMALGKEDKVIPLWPKSPPGDEPKLDEERDTTTPESGKVAGRRGKTNADTTKPLSSQEAM